MRLAKQALLGGGILLILSSLLTGCGRTVAKVNGDKISRKEYFRRLENLPVNINGEQRQAGGVVLEQLIQEKLRLQLAEKEDVSPTNEQIDKRVERMRREGVVSTLKQQGLTDDEIRENARLQQAVFNLLGHGITVTDKEARKFYADNKANAFTTVAGADFGAIVCRSKARIDMARRLLKVKKTQFGSVAMRYGDIEDLRRSQGYMGFLPRDIRLIQADRRPPKAIYDAVFALKSGEVGEPMLVGGVWYIIKVYNQRRGEVKSYNSVRDRIKERLALEKAGKRERAKARAKQATADDRFRKHFKESRVRINVRRFVGLWNQMKQRVEMEESALQTEQPKAEAAK